MDVDPDFISLAQIVDLTAEFSSCRRVFRILTLELGHGKVCAH